MRLRFHHHLALAIDCRDADIALHPAVTALERGTFRIGQVALDRLALGTDAFARRGQRRAQLAGVPAQRGQRALFLAALAILVGIERLAGIVLGVRLDQMGNGALHLRRLALEVGARAAPFLGGVRGQRHRWQTRPTRTWEVPAGAGSARRPCLPIKPWALHTISTSRKTASTSLPRVATKCASVVKCGG